MTLLSVGYLKTRRSCSPNSFLCTERFLLRFFVPSDPESVHKVQNKPAFPTQPEQAWSGLLFDHQHSGDEEPRGLYDNSETLTVISRPIFAGLKLDDFGEMLGRRSYVLDFRKLDRHLSFVAFCPEHFC